MKNHLCNMMMVAALMCATQVSAQTATDPGEGLRAAVGSSSGTTAISWWGKAGRTYFVQTCVTLMEADWRYVPVIESGSGAVITWNLSSSAERGFVRLVYTDEVYTGPVADADFDNDGLSNGQEIALDLRTDPFKADSDGDGFDDEEEYTNGTDALSAASNAERGTETGLMEKPVSVFGYFKSVSNDWYDPPWTSWVSWADSMPTYGNADYTGFNSQVDTRLGPLAYPNDISKLTDYSWTGVTGTAWKSQGTGVGHGSVYHVKACLATTTRGETQPWSVSRNFLHYSASRSVTVPEASYGVPLLHQFTILPNSEVSNFTFLEPAITDQSTVEQGLLYPEVWGYNLTLDWESTTVAGVTDHWLMLPKDTPKTVNFLGTTAVGHRLVYKISGGGVTASGPIVTNNIVRTEIAASDNATLTGGTAGYDGVIYAGIAWGASGPPQWAEERPMMKVAVLPERDFTVIVHPIGLLSSTGAVLASPTECPSASELQNYLGAVFGVQANVWPTVTKLETAYVNYDVGVGVPGGAQTVGNGCFEFFFNNSSTLTRVNSDEEIAILAASPQTGADVHVYYVAGTGLIGNGQLGLNKTWYDTELRFGWPALGHAGKAGRAARGGRVYVWNNTRTADDPTALFTIAHEIMHYVGDVNHSTYLGDNNHMPNSDNENRLMTGLEGPKRKLGPKTLLKKEWQRLNDLYGFLNLEQESQLGR